MRSPSSPSAAAAPRYYYEDGRGNKVWVQNLSLDYDALRPSGGGWRGRRQERSATPCGAPRPPPPARGVSARTEWRRQTPSRGADAPPTRCTCDCPLHSALPPGAGVAWTFLPEASLAGVIHTVDDAEFILAKLRGEERLLRGAHVW
ncbi:uncharacterized protein Tco025E_07148 [Trypanosoma conorhini]|uniref:Uncharacterized protein n=1 Tax=Trypanosoma conorhini TaxID=83891 RepID=A0A3R7L7D7_9TRYP|nr:uncharacterized protein Tco025E_07148 [Trypanosoma conorhini]RNF09065.1 hypothetical protein Tco025E_07148 [Trypanosoma conorhini]